MIIETIACILVVFGGAALVMLTASVLAQCEDEARRMVRDERQLHYGLAD